MRRPRVQLRIWALMVAVAVAALAFLWEVDRRYSARLKSGLAMQGNPPMVGD